MEATKAARAPYRIARRIRARSTRERALAEALALARGDEERAARLMKTALFDVALDGGFAVHGVRKG